MGEFDDINTEEDNKQQQEETTQLAIGEYLHQVIQMKQVEYYEGFWHTLLKWLTLSQDIVIFRHMKNKYAYLDISICDLIWMIFLCSFTISIGLGIGMYYLAKRDFENTHCQTHEVIRYYQDQHHMLPTEHPDYIRQISDVIPCAEYAKIIKYKLERRFPTATNYYYVSKRDGYAYYNEVSDEEFDKALKEYKRRKYTAEAHKILLEAQRKRQQQKGKSK